MPGDGIVRIGAEFDKTNVDAGLSDTQEMVQASMAAINSTIQEAGAKTKAAWRGLSEEVKQGAQNVSAEMLKVAETSRAVAASQADVRRAVTLTRDATIPAAESMAFLAAAQQKLAADQAASAAAIKAASAATVEGAEEVALSSNAIVAGFQRAELAVAESMAGMRERVALSGKSMDLSMRDWIPQFAGIGELLGAALIAGFAKEQVDSMAEINVQLSHLSVETGISISKLAGLQLIVKEMGGDWDPVSRSLIVFQKNLVEVSQKQVAYVRAVNAIGLSWDDLKGHTPEEQLGIVAKAFANVSDTERVAYAAKTLFGRGGQELIPILKEEGAQLEANMQREGALTGITDQTAAAARRWTEDVARLTAQFRSYLMPVMEYAPDVIAGVAGAFKAAYDVVLTGTEVIARAAITLVQNLALLGRLTADVFQGNWAAIKSDAQSAVESFKSTWKTGFADIASAWKSTYHTFTDKIETPELPKGIDLGDMEAPPARGSKGARGASAIQKDEQQLDALKTAHELTLGEEIRFWQERLAAAKKGSAEYEAILAKLAPLMQRAMKLPGNTEPLDVLSPDLSKVEISADAIDKTVAQHAAAVKEIIDGDRAAAQEKIRIAQQDYQDLSEKLRGQVELGKMTDEQRLDDLRKAAAEERRIVQEQSHFLQMLDMGDAQRYRQDLNQEAQQQRQWARTIDQINLQLALDTKSHWQQIADQMQQSLQQMTVQFNQAVGQWVVTGHGFAQTMAQAMGNLTRTMTAEILKQTEQWLAGFAKQKLGLKGQIFADAKTAAANTWSAVSAIPVVGPFLAPPAAAAAFAGVMALDSFDAGGVVRGGGAMGVPVLAHAGERVLSREQTANFEQMVNRSSSTSSSVTQHLHYEPVVHAYDRSGMRSTLRSHADDVLDIVRQGYRSGALKPA